MLVSWLSTDAMIFVTKVMKMTVLMVMMKTSSGKLGLCDEVDVYIC